MERWKDSAFSDKAKFLGFNLHKKLNKEGYIASEEFGIQISVVETKGMHVLKTNEEVV